VQALFQFLLFMNHETISLPNFVENVKLRSQRTQASSNEKARDRLKNSSTRAFGNSSSSWRRSVCRQGATPRAMERCRCGCCCHSRWPPLSYKVKDNTVQCSSSTYRANKTQRNESNQMKQSAGVQRGKNDLKKGRNKRYSERLILCSAIAECTRQYYFVGINESIINPHSSIWKLSNLTLLYVPLLTPDGLHGA
jgi:hypothetical protein